MVVNNSLKLLEAKLPLPKVIVKMSDFFNRYNCNDTFILMIVNGFFLIKQTKIKGVLQLFLKAQVRRVLLKEQLTEKIIPEVSVGILLMHIERPLHLNAYCIR